MCRRGVLSVRSFLMAVLTVVGCQSAPAPHDYSAEVVRAAWRFRIRYAVAAIALLAIILPVVLVLPFRLISPPTSAFMLRYHVHAASGSTLRHRWVDFDHMSPHVVAAVVAAEDQRFLDHHGFDVESIRNALRDAERGGRVRGASTISQQVTKNLFLWSEPSLVRKGLEAYGTVLIELLWPKRRILEVYLNVAEFGDGIYGVAAASEYFFKIGPAGLESDQAALLAAVLPNPRVLRVDTPSSYVRHRQAWIRGQMVRVGVPSFFEALAES
jgi:monofunctional glycosyltransferase